MIDPIGILFSAPGDPPEGWTPDEPWPQPEPLPGWHVNVTPEVMAARPELEAFLVTPHPQTLMRVWAGDDPANPVHTVPLRFDSEDAMRAAFGGDPEDPPAL